VAVFDTIALDHAALELLSLEEKVNLAITKFEQTPRKLWSYNVSRYEDEEGDVTSSIEQYLPQAPESWVLKQINGQEPTEKQIKNFVKKKQKQSKKTKQGESIQVNLRELINRESLSLVSDDKESTVMAFNVHFAKLGKDSVGKLQGQLVYKRDSQFIQQITIWNNEEFSPMLTANITDLEIIFTFSHINGAVLIKQNEMKMKGSFAYFTEINENSIDIYTGYQYHGK
jgi:hypothetical protein